MPNRRDFDHIARVNFRVEIEGVYQGAVVSVYGLEAATEVIEFDNGDDVVLRKRPGRTRYGNILIRRGFTGTTEFWDWHRTVSDGLIQRKAGSVILMGDDAKTEILRYNFFEGWPCRWRSLELDTSRPGVLTEEIEIVVEKIERG